ncbi:hypothetical protein COCMIDRAFT_1688 [Bipolaris oryzae ATCC 44560]|uniref:Uncharacterized protein n=1 Tax=Bipolaris oryzae ATCC 44560 TaxID=930090 RepID=W6ZI55_COCMI|nr:uncharacterized protein COCMIDRAFT_1688 [Bipolaris oryzae ATCC 44560]EUC49653.1 hypothetical protein COCMIDRAFT_1688 [Bipolaris oryzae ATCC 44560]
MRTSFILAALAACAVALPNPLPKANGNEPPRDVKYRSASISPPRDITYRSAEAEANGNEPPRDIKYRSAEAEVDAILPPRDITY